MIFHTSIRRELMRSFSAALFVLSGIMVTMMLIRTLRVANSGLVSPSEVSLVLGYTVLAYFPTLLTLSLFISMVYCLSRMYRDSEMAVWFSSGQGLFQFLRPLLGFAWPIILLISALSLVIWPWANTQISGLHTRFQMRSDIDRIAPGQFQESSDGNRVFYISNDPVDSSSGRRLFAFARQPHSEVLISARSGRIENQENGRFIVLNNGQITEIMEDKVVHTGQFQEYGIRIGDRARSVAENQGITPQNQLPPRNVPSFQLLSMTENRFRAELGWRLGMAMAGINFVLIALVSANVNPRSGRSGSLIFALLSFAVYYNLINVTRNWVGTGKSSLSTMLLLLHGGVFVVVLLWLLMRHQNWSWRDLLQKKRYAARIEGKH